MTNQKIRDFGLISGASGPSKSLFLLSKNKVFGEIHFFHFFQTLGRPGLHSGSIFRSFWCLGAFLEDFGASFGRLWGFLGCLWDPLEGSLGTLGSLLGSPWESPGPFGAPKGRFGSDSGSILGIILVCFLMTFVDVLGCCCCCRCCCCCCYKHGKLRITALCSALCSAFCSALCFALCSALCFALWSALCFALYSLLCSLLCSALLLDGLFLF